MRITSSSPIQNATLPDHVATLSYFIQLMTSGIVAPFSSFFSLNSLSIYLFILSFSCRCRHWFNCKDRWMLRSKESWRILPPLISLWELLKCGRIAYVTPFTTVKNPEKSWSDRIQVHLNFKIPMKLLLSTLFNWQDSPRIAKDFKVFRQGFFKDLSRIFRIFRIDWGLLRIITELLGSRMDSWRIFRILQVYGIY